MLGLFIAIVMPFYSLTVYADSQTKDVTIEHFRIKVTNSTGDQGIELANCKVEILYKNNNWENQIIDEVYTDKNGSINNKVLRNVPGYVNSITFRFYFGNDDRGYIIKSNGQKYNVSFTKSFQDNNIINYDKEATFNGISGGAEEFYTVSKLSKSYDAIYNDQINTVNYAKSILKELPDMHFENIDIVLEKNYYLDKGCMFYRNGLDNIKRPIILIGDSSSLNDDYLNINIAHEWAHFNMYRATGMPGGNYSSHYSYNNNPQTSYKEGWALFQTNRYNFGMKWSFKNDILVQNDRRLFGKSTNLYN